MSEAKYQYFCTKCGTTRDSLLDHPAIGIGGYSWNCPRCNGPVDSREIVVSEAPKKIWKVDGYWEFYSTNEGKNETLYIRADIFDEVVKALKYVMTAHGEQLSDAFEKAQNALAKLEEEQ